MYNEYNNKKGNPMQTNIEEIQATFQMEYYKLEMPSSISNDIKKNFLSMLFMTLVELQIVIK